MSPTETFIHKLDELKAGDRARLRHLAGQSLDYELEGFDLFTGLWWPLRQESPKAPERRSGWLVAKLHGSFPLRSVREKSAALPCVLGRREREQPDSYAIQRFRQRFDELLLSPVARLEPHLGWALRIAKKAVGQGREEGVDWVQLLDDLRIWDRRTGHGRGGDIRDIWAYQYLNPFN